MNLKGNYHVCKSSAGSGKTFTLAKFYLSLILKNPSQDYFRHILAITFTVKAAAEMKNRIIHYLSGFASKGRLSPDHLLMLDLISKELELKSTHIQNRSRLILNAILHDYSSLSIFTIDKFVHKLVRSFASELHLNPDFEVEIDSKQLVERVVSETLNKVGVENDITELILRYTKEQLDSDKYWDVTSSLESIAAELNGEEFHIHARELDNLGPSGIFTIQDELRKTNTEISDIAQKLGGKAMNLIKGKGLISKDLAYGARGVFDFFQAAENEELIKLIDPNSNVLKAIDEDKWQSGTKSPLVLDIKDELLNILLKIIDHKPQFRQAIFNQRLIPQLYRTGLINEFQNLFTSIKEDENQQLLSDFYRVLSDKFSNDQTPFIFERLGNKYNHILIDEFQDTSQLQWINLLPLLENSIAEGHASLVVGDAKQSIYRFRGSEPSQFINQPVNNRSTDQLLSAEFNLSVLNSNYRSAGTIVQFNNRFFSELSNTFLEKSEQEFYADVSQTAEKDLDGFVSIVAIEKEEDITIQELLFEPISRQIQDLLKKGALPGEICLLFRKNTDASYFAGRLLQLGFPVTSDESLLLDHNPGVQLLISTIKAMSNPFDSFYLQLWLSRLSRVVKLNLNYHEIAIWLKTEKASFHQLTSKLNLKLNESTFNQNSFRVIWELIKCFGLNKEDVFIKCLLDFSLLYDENAAYLKTSFIEHWDKQSQKLSIENTAGNSIQIMTIHKSKGLEFPHVLVYLPEFQQRKTTKNLAWIDDTGIESMSKTPVEVPSLKGTNYESVLDEEKAKTSVDLINTLYVALTRAKQTLNVYTTTKDGEIIPVPLRFVQNWEEWNEKSSSLILK